MSEESFGVETGEASASGPEVTEAATAPVSDPYGDVWADVEKEPVLQPFMEKFKAAVTPHFDRVRQEATKDFEGYQPFREAGVTPAQLSSAYGIYRMVSENPQYLYEQLGQRLGISPQQAQQVVEQTDDDGEYVDPTIKAIKQVQQEQADELEELRNEKFRAQARSDLERDYNKIQDAHAKSNLSGLPLPTQTLYDRVQAQMFRGEEPSIIKAYETWANEVTAIRGMPTPGSLAPRITPSSGGSSSLPLNQSGGQIPDDILTGSEDKFKEYVKKNYLSRPQQAG